MSCSGSKESLCGGELKVEPSKFGYQMKGGGQLLLVDIPKYSSAASVSKLASGGSRTSITKSLFAYPEPRPPGDVGGLTCI